MLLKNVQIGDSAFAECTQLTAVEIAEGVRIDKHAFWDCTGLRELVIHEGVTVARMAFEGCNSLRFIIMPDDLPKDIFPETATIVTHSKINRFFPASLAKFREFAR